ncbi:CPSF A subunit region-domain-containing protein [Hygrophoropsis aurantiaca]|uniref:CPSF A subunit region-domain-containing protein n=1 Tax=Hygrophoropsis aurantiaca TaxID=72124 RepID=A0ACB8ABF5_9AGAM|nr:CPSF A subunit region-domain-containing protein [Hygrophoropsis aurantiaca]
MKIVTTFHPSSSVLDSAKLQLSDEDGSQFLVVAKLNRVEFHSVKPEGLRHEQTLEIWGRIHSIRPVPIESPHRLTVLVLTDHPEPQLIFVTFTVHDCNSSEVKATKYLSLFERNARASEFYHNMLVDPTARIAVVSVYVGKLKIVLLGEEGQYDRDFDASLPELNLLALAFVPSLDEATLAILHVDHRQRLQLLSRTVSVDDLQISPLPSSLLPAAPLPEELFDVPDAIPFLIPIASYGDQKKFNGGILVVGGRRILLYEFTSEESQGKHEAKQRRLEKKKKSTDSVEARNAKRKEEEREDRKKKVRAIIEWPWAEVTAWCPIDERGQRFFLGTKFGQLAMLSVNPDCGNDATILTLFALGETSPPTTLTYITNQITYLGSHLGDSQLLKINPTPVSNLESRTLRIPSDIYTIKPSALAALAKGKQGEVGSGYIVNGHGNYISEIENYKNLAPIVDAAVVDVDNSGQYEVVTCSGGGNTGSIKVVRNGADLQIAAILEGISDVTNIWPIGPHTFDRVDTHLIVSTLQETFVFRFDGGGAVSRVENPAKGFLLGSPTLTVMNLKRRTPKRPGQPSAIYSESSLVVQVFPKGLLLLDYDTGLGEYTRVTDVQKIDQFLAQSTSTEIVAASANSSQILLALNLGTLVVLNVSEGGKIQYQKHHKFNHYPRSGEISAVSCTPLDPSKPFATCAAVSFWESNHVEIVSLTAQSSIPTLCKTPSLTSLPRSLLLNNFASNDPQGRNEIHPHLLVGMSDGSVGSFVFKGGKELVDQKFNSIGGLPVSLHSCDINGRQVVFACGSRTSILFWEKDRLRQSPLMVKDVTAASPINTSSYKSSLVVACPDGLFIGNLQDLERLHIRSIPLGNDVPRRIAHSPSLRAFGVACIRETPCRIGETSSLVGSIHVYNDTTFEKIGHVILKENEEVLSLQNLVVSLDAGTTPLLCAGTMIFRGDESEPSDGRLILLSSDTSRSQPPIVIAASEHVKGCVYATASTCGMVAAAVNSSVIVYRLDHIGNQATLTLCKVAEWNHNYVVTSLVSRGDKLFVGDAISSVSLLKMSDNQLRSIARDYGPLWPVSIEMFSDKNMIGANSDYNLFTFSLQTTQLQTTLERDGNYHLGDLVNKFVPGSLTAYETSNDITLSPKQLFFTSSGQIGVVIDVADELALHLTALQRNLSNFYSRRRGANHTRFRAPKSAIGRSDAETTSYGFLDGDFLEHFLQYSGSLETQREIMQGQSEPETLTISMDRLSKVLERLQSMH